MITDEKRSVVVRYWFEKAEESMTSPNVNSKQDLYPSP